MNPLTVQAIGPATLSGLGVVWPPRALPSAGAQGAAPPTTAPLSAQDLVQGLFQRALQTAALFPVAEPAAGSAGLALESAVSLLAALNAPQAPANATPLPNSQAPSSTAQVQATQAPTSPSPTPPATINEIPAAQDALETSSSPDFALQTALRFGAGVVAQSAPVQVPGDLGPGLVRDATSVLRLENLQPHAGGPGPEAFTRPQAPLQRILRSYPPPTPESPVSLDLMA